MTTDARVRLQTGGLVVLMIALLLCTPAAPAGAQTTTLASGPAWTVYAEDPGLTPDPNGPTSRGPARPICLRDGWPLRCPADALRWGSPLGVWSADLTPIPDAVWVSAPGVTPETRPSVSTWFLSASVVLDRAPDVADLLLAADNYAQIRVNGAVIGAVGSVTDEPVAVEATQRLVTFDLLPSLRVGTNVITIEARNGIVGLCDCAHSEDPAGVVFGGVTANQPAGTTTSVTAARSGLVHGERVTVSARVASPATTPTGAVQFFVDGSAVGGPVGLDGTGGASVETARLTSGDRTVRAEYRPSGEFASSTGETRFSVGKAETVTALDASPTKVVAGQEQTLTATVRVKAPGAGRPTGTVQFSEEDIGPLCDPEPVSADGTATITGVPTAGTFRFRATYSGDTGFGPSAVGRTDELGRADTVVRLGSAPNPVPVGGAWVLTVFVEVVPPGDVPRFGTVQVTDDGMPLGGPIPLDGADGVSVTFVSLGGPRTDSIAVTYSGDENTNPSSATLLQTTAGAAVQPPTAGGGATGRRTGGPGAAARVDAALLRDMTAPLVAALRRRGMTALRRSVQRLRAPAAGRLEQRVYTVGARRVLVAFAAHSFAAAGEGRLALGLTAAGRRIVRSSRAGRGTVRRATTRTLSIVTRFAPERGRAVVVRQRVRVGAPGNAVVRSRRVGVADARGRASAEPREFRLIRVR